MELEPNNLASHHNLVLALERVGEYDQSLAACAKAMEISPDDSGLQKLELRVRVLKIRAKVLRVGRKLVFWKS